MAMRMLWRGFSRSFIRLLGFVYVLLSIEKILHITLYTTFFNIHTRIPHFLHHHPLMSEPFIPPSNCPVMLRHGFRFYNFKLLTWIIVIL